LTDRDFNDKLQHELSNAARRGVESPASKVRRGLAGVVDGAGEESPLRNLVRFIALLAELNL
jgi:hypothetical protein